MPPPPTTTADAAADTPADAASASAPPPPTAGHRLVRAAIRSPMWRALRHPAVRRWAGAGLVSSTGSWMQLVAQSWLVLELTGSGLALGGTVAAQALPGVTLGLWGGLLADRLPRRRLLLATQAAFVVLAGTQALLVATGHLSAWMLPVLGLLAGSVAAFDGPAAATFGADLVPPEDLSNALALGSVSSSLARVAGMAAAGVILAAAGPAAVFGVNALSYLPVLAVLARMDPRAITPREPEPRAPGQIRAGLRYVATHAELRATLVLAFVLGALGRNYQVTMALMCADELDGGAGAYGALSVAFAVGAVGGALVAARIRHLGTGVLLLAATASGATELLAAGAPTITWFGAAVLGAAVAAVVLDTAVATRSQLAADPARRGRVVAVVGLVGSATGALGAPLLGWMAGLAGPRGALAIGAVVCLATVAAVARPLTGRTVGALVRTARRGVGAPVPTTA